MFIDYESSYMNVRNYPDFSDRFKHQEDFFINRKGNLLVFGRYPKRADPFEIYTGLGKYKLTEDVIKKKAFDIGVERVKLCIEEAAVHRETGDDYIPSINPAHRGSGFKIAVFTGNKLKFEKGTAYSTDYILDSMEKLDDLKFDYTNDWIKLLLKYWEGIESVFVPGILVAPFLYKSPLDLANGLRGNEIFTDMYTNPEFLDRLLSFCTENMIMLDTYLRNNVSILNSEPNGVFGMYLQGKVIWMNGDPVDLISVEFGNRFNKTSLERLADYSDSLYLHHHSIGYDRANSISTIRGLRLQNISQDPTGPNLFDVIDSSLIEASLRTPIDLGANLSDVPDPEQKLKQLCKGRFILHIETDTLDYCKDLVNLVRKYSGF